MRAQGPGDASGASIAAALGTMIKEFGSHNVAALNEIRMGETRGIRAVPSGFTWHMPGNFPGVRWLLARGSVLRWDGPNDGSKHLTETYLDLDLTQEDVVLQFDLAGTQLGARAWRPGEPKPDAPQIQIRDSRLPAGGVGITAGDCTAPSDSVTSVFRWVEVVAPSPGDFNANEVLDAEDIDLLRREAGRPTPRLWPFDLNDDGVVNLTDHQIWVHELKKTWYGDADLNGEFNSNDFVQVFQAGKYETGTEAGWAEGDWNGDLVFDSADFVTALEDGGYELGPPTDVAVVPEPGGWLLVVIGLPLWLFGRHSRRAV